MDKGYLLGVDIGTYSSKGVLVDLEGNVVGSHIIPHGMANPKPGHFEHDADGIWWRDFVIIVKKILSDTGIDSKLILSIGTSGIGPCVLPIDKEGKPLRPAILYGIDTRATEEIDYLHKVLKESSNPSLREISLNSQATGPKILWLRNKEPDIYAKARWFLTSESYLVYKLTGKDAIDIYTAGANAPLFDSDTKTYIKELEHYITKIDRLPQFYWSHEKVGEVTAEAEAVTGLAKGTPVIAGTTDASAEAISAGLANVGDMMLMLGSSIFFILKTDRLVKSKKFWTSNFLSKDTYAFLGGLSTSGSLTRWFLNEFGHVELSAEKQGGPIAYAALADLAASSPAGAKGLVALPYFEGERTPLHDPMAKGVLFGLSIKHTRADVYRSILESVAYGIRHNLDEMQEEQVKPERILAVGGGTKNRVWLQIVSDVSNIPLCVPEQQIGASYGDAFLAGLGVGVFDNYSDISKWVKMSDLITPKPNYKSAYDFNYRIFRNLYDRTKSLMHDISKNER